MQRCEWANGSELYATYHDKEWGVVSTDDRHLFEMLILEGAQAGLSWITILKKRDNYRQAYYGFDPEKDMLPADKMLSLDKWAVETTRQLQTKTNEMSKIL